MQSNETLELPVTVRSVKRLKKLGFRPRSNYFNPYKELCISHFPRTVKELLFKFLKLHRKYGEVRLIWITDNVLVMDDCIDDLAEDFLPTEGLPLCYIKVDFCDRSDDGFFPIIPPTYSPTQFTPDDSKSTEIGILAFTANDAVSVLEQLAQLPDKQDFVWKITLEHSLEEPDLIRRALECLPTTVRRDFTLTQNPFRTKVCSLVLAPRGSRIRLCLKRCTFGQRAENAFIEAVAAREDTHDHLLCLRLDRTFFDTHNFIRLLESKKVDTLEFDLYVLDRLDNNCIQALTRSQLRRLHVNPERSRFTRVAKYTPFLNSLQFGGDHLKELVLNNVVLEEEEEEENNCLVTILRSNPGLIFFGIFNSRLCMKRWLELLDAIRTHPSLTCLDLSSWWNDEYREDRTDAISRLLSENPRIEKLYGCDSITYNETLFRQCVEPKLEWNWYRSRVQKLRAIRNTLTRDALIAKALAVLDGKPSVRYLLLSKYCDVIVMHLSVRHDRKGLKRRRHKSR